MWDPRQYLAYADERSRPFFDLVSRIGAPPDAVASVVDLGCGPGQLTAQLTQLWPQAAIVGVDSSPAMITAAGPLASGGRLRFEQADLRHWHPDEAIDVIVSNATLQWIPEHRDLLGRFLSWLRPGGWLAFQVPGNFQAPSHRLLAELRLSPRWFDAVGVDAVDHLAVDDPAGYAELVGDLGCTVDAWETTYLHLLRGPDPVVEWVKGTALRPVLAALTDLEAAAFLGEYATALRAAYPANSRGITSFPFRRIFVVAHLAA